MSKQEPILLKRIGKMADPTSVDQYRGLGGFEGIQKAISMGKEQILEEMSLALLRGRGGAAYPAGQKWKHLYGIEGDTKYIVCNADEGEPGTFKDKILLEQDPLSVIEGMLIAGYLFGSRQGFIYIRGEYRAIQSVFQKALDNALKAGYLGENILGIAGFDYNITIITGAGAYVCGENSALLNSIEGKTGRPRIKPPHLAEVGLYGKPTLVNNVETFANVPVVMTMGGQRYLELGTPGGGGTKLVSLSGHAKNRGVYEVRLGTPLHDLLYAPEYGGGTSTGRPIQFCHFGGQSGPIGFIDQLDIPFSYDGLWDGGLAMGSGAIVVLDDSVNIIEYNKHVMDFFIHESCGKCTPCRLGTTRVSELLQDMLTGRSQEGDLDRLEHTITQIGRVSACGLGQAAGTALLSCLKHDRASFAASIH